MRFAKLWACLGLMVGGSALAAPTPPVPESPAEIAEELRKFGELRRVLYVAAHPDDENTELITYFSRGRDYRTAYLSLTRGDGGQNELGRDFDEKLGVARTQELLAARRIDGGQQFFTRAIDFGFSKTPEETLLFWGRENVLSDVVRVIREFRPDVIITRFPIPPGSGGHGHHTASAMLAVEAFQLAGDASAFPEQLPQGLSPWQPKRIFWNVFGRGRGTQGLSGPTIEMNIAGTDPITGEFFSTLANRSRGMHKTQGLGRFATVKGNGEANLQTFLLLGGEPARNDVMDDIAGSWARVPGGEEIAKLTAAAQSAFKQDDPAASVPALLEIRGKLASLPHDPVVDEKRAQLDRLVAGCLGLQVETIAANPEAVPGEALKLQFRIKLKSAVTPVRWIGFQSAALKEAKLSLSGPMALRPAETLSGEIAATLAADAPISQPYWLRDQGNGAFSRVDDPALIGEPENPAPVQAGFTFEVGGQQLLLVSIPTSRQESRPARRLEIIPPVSLAFEAATLLVLPGERKTVSLTIRAARAPARGTVTLALPAGWSFAPVSPAFSLAQAGDTARIDFAVTAPVPANPGQLSAFVEIDGHRYSYQRQEIAYAHLPGQLLQPPATVRLASFDLEVRAKKIGYLPGAGDNVADALRQMGCEVAELSGPDLTPEKLNGFDAVVLGVRAFNERADLAPNFAGLMAYVEAGGTVIAQYNRPERLQTDRLGPAALSIQGSAPMQRVTDETAPVTFLAPDNRAMVIPNRITQADFQGWVQERGAYFPSSWDESKYTALFAMADPGEAPLRGSVLIAQHGKGHYVYTGIGFFRQLPAGVPGAYRLLANLLSLGK